MLQEIARTFLSMRRKTRDSYVTKILLAQEKALADFISLARCRIDGDLPKEGDYRLMWECLERELRTLVNTGEGSWSLNLSTEFVSLAVAMFSKLCEKQEMTRYRLWSRSCLATVVVYLERYRAQTPAGTEYT